MSEEKYQTLFDMATDSLVILDLDGYIEDINRAGHERLGYTKEEMVGRCVSALHAPEFSSIVFERLAELKVNGSAIFESAHVRKDGSVMPIEINARTVELDGELKLFGIIRDISERKCLSYALTETEAMYHGAIETSADGFWVADMHGRFLEVNDAYLRRSGYSREELLAMSIYEIEAKEELEETKAHIRQLARDGYACFESVHRAKDGSLWPVEVTCSFWPIGGGRIFVYLTDISGRRRIEETVRINKNNYRALSDNMLDGFAHCRMLYEGGNPQDFVFLEVNAAFERLTGLKKVLGKRSSEVIHDIRDSNPELFEICGRVALGSEPERFEMHFKALGMWFSIAVYSLEQEHFIAVFDNITERKRNEQILYKRLDNLARHANDIILLSDSEGRVVDVNERAMEAYGYGRNEFSRLHIADLRAPESEPEFNEIQERILRMGSMRFESEHVHKDGSRFWVESSVRVIDIDGEKYFQNIARDISGRKQAEAMLRDRERRLSEAQRLAKLGSWSWDVASGDVYWSEELYRIFGYDHKLPIPAYEEYLSMYQPGSRVLFELGIEQARYAGQSNEFDLELLMQADLRKWVTARFEAVRNNEGRVVAIRGTIQDISERKRQEAQLQVASKEVSDLYNNAPCGYHSLDKDGIIVSINYTELTWLGYQRQEVVGKMRFPSLLTTKSKAVFYETFPRLKKQGWIRDIELELIRKNGGIVSVLLSATVVKDEHGNFLMTRSTVYDMTDRRILEQERADHARRLQELAHSMVDLQEQERRWLSSELHDRSSANLAAIDMNFRNLAGSLSPAALSSVEDLLADTRALLEDTTASIRDICSHLRPALLDYAGLWPALESYAQQFSRRTGIGVNIEKSVQHVRFAPNIESKLFRIVQEALLNSAKHSRAESVAVRMEQGDACTVLAISDNGQGFDPASLGHSGEKPGMGLIMMRERAEFFGGRFSFKTEPGQGVHIRVAIPDKICASGRSVSQSFTQ